LSVDPAWAGAHAGSPLPRPSASTPPQSSGGQARGEHPQVVAYEHLHVAGVQVDDGSGTRWLSRRHDVEQGAAALARLRHEFALFLDQLPFPLEPPGPEVPALHGGAEAAGCHAASAGSAVRPRVGPGINPLC